MTNCHYHVETSGASTGSENAIFKNEFLAKLRYARELKNIRRTLKEKENNVERHSGTLKASFSDGSAVQIYPCTADCMEIVENED